MTVEVAGTNEEQGVRDDNPTRRRSGRRKGWLVESLERWALLIIFVIMFAFFSLNATTSQYFTSSANIQTVIANQAVLGVLAVASIAPLVCRQFDLSVGAIAGLSQIAIASAMSEHGAPTWFALALGVVIGAVVGAVNGALVTIFRVNALIATLGVSTVIAGLISWYTQGQTIVTGISERLVSFGQGTWLGLPTLALCMLAIAALVAYVLAQLPFGRYLHFVGSSPESANLVGLGVRRLTGMSFVMSGALSGVAGLMLVARNGNGDPTVGPNLTLLALSAVFLGATAVFPGRYNVPGTIIGILFLGFGVNGLIYLGVDTWIHDVFNGVALVVAVAASSLLGRQRAQGGL